MSLNSSRLSLANVSAYSDIPDVEDISNISVLNSHVKQKDLEVSLLPTEEDASRMTDSNTKLSITLDPAEREQLKNAKRKEIRTDSITKTNSTFANGSVATDTESTLKDDASINQTITVEEYDGEKESKVSVVTNNSKTLQSFTLDDDSVIPLDDDDEVTEVCSIDETQKSVAHSKKSTENNMFAHLQPSETQNKLDEKMEVDEPAALESFVEEQHMDYTKPNEHGYFKNSFVELARRLWPSSSKRQCYTKGCLWSPDGTCLLVPVHMNGMHVMELPIDLYTTQELDTERELSTLSSAVHVKEGGMVYDVAWFPFMASTDPATCCWLATRQHEPIHMWDAFTGELRCSYRGYDVVDEVESAISVAFSNDAQKIVAGYKKSIKIFDTNTPGRDYNCIRVKQAISCMTFTTENDNCVTAGSWNSYIYHYDLRAPKLGPLFTLGGHRGGITWLKYSSYNTDNWYLFSGARMDDKIHQWDMRNYQAPVKTYERKVQTNQRIYFDLSPMHKWLISGGSDHCLRIWDMDGKEENMEIPLHSDCCNGVSCHPTLPILATSSGQYHFLEGETKEKPESSNGTDSEETINYENSVLLLWFGPQKSVE